MTSKNKLFFVSYKIPAVPTSVKGEDRRQRILSIKDGVSRLRTYVGGTAPCFVREQNHRLVVISPDSKFLAKLKLAIELPAGDDLITFNRAKRVSRFVEPITGVV